MYWWAIWFSSPFQLVQHFLTIQERCPLFKRCFFNLWCPERIWCSTRNAISAHLRGLSFKISWGSMPPYPLKSLNNLNFLNFLKISTEEFLSAKSLIGIVAGKVLHSVVVNYLLISWIKSIKTSYFYRISEFSFCIYGEGAPKRIWPPSVKSTPPRHWKAGQMLYI